MRRFRHFADGLKICSLTIVNSFASIVSSVATINYKKIKTYLVMVVMAARGRRSPTSRVQILCDLFGCVSWELSGGRSHPVRNWQVNFGTNFHLPTFKMCLWKELS